MELEQHKISSMVNCSLIVPLDLQSFQFRFSN